MLRTASCYKEQPTVSTCPGSPDVKVGPGQIAWTMSHGIFLSTTQHFDGGTSQLY